MNKKIIIAILVLAPIILGILIGYFSSIPTENLLATVLLVQVAVLIGLVIGWLIKRSRNNKS